MTFKHKLSRRLAQNGLAAVLLMSAACAGADETTAPPQFTPFDSVAAAAVPATTPDGTQIVTLGVTTAYNSASISASIGGTQPAGAVGTIIDGPTRITSSQPVAFWAINFQSGRDGWIRADQIGLRSAPPPSPAPVATVAVTPVASNVQVGATTQLTATLRDAGGNALSGRTVTWASANGAIATVSSSGLVSAVGAGTVNVTATSEGRSGSASITVTTAPPSPAPVATVTVTPASSNLVVGATAQLAAALRDANGNVLTGRTTTWSSANANVATVSTSGLVTARAAGTVAVTATSEGRTGTASIVVTVAAPVPVATVTVAPASTNLVVGATATLGATLRDANGNTLTGRAVTWSSMNASIASVSSSGVVTAAGAGTVLVSATSEGRSGTATVVVTAAPPPPPGQSGLFWASDFSGGTGASSTALLDRGSWSLIGGQGLTVMSAAGLNFPTTNVLQVNALSSSTGFAMLRTTTLGTLAVSESRFYRHYARYTFPDNLPDNQTHPIQDGGAGSQINWAWSIRHNNGGAGNYTAGLKLHTNNEFDLAEWTSPVLRKGVTYRFEHQVQRVSASQFRMHVRIYDANGALVADDDDFRSNYNTTTLASNPLFNFNDANNIAGLNAGNNGIGGSPSWPFVYSYQGGFAVCRTNWCGAYVAGEGR